jgi:hypothetical protein
MGDLNTTPATWTAGEFPTATKMNTEIRDALTTLQSAWTAYTPALSGGWVLSDGTLNGRYHRIGKTVLFRIEYTIGAADTKGGSAITFTLPVAASIIAGFTNQPPINGTVHLFDVSATARNYGYYSVMPTSTTVRPVNVGSTAGVSATSPWTWATGDIMMIVGTYEAA